ncbi:hypothetical protein MSG28_014413 [Choristoneura fumiferana]|uniref:Uncharacterized protein n=1 Tax=Choristoneura fumiferana TaxID=7141 RepID=A0ACC0JRT3_CHOFU|nr:hypothetical protein MSG28_014413 [Choristoneura fumiferana]
MARDDGKRPDGVTLVPWKLGRALVWDATCVDTFALSHIQATSSQAGAVADQAQILKRRKYSSLLKDYEFAALAVETLGPWSADMKFFIKALSSRLVDASGDPRAGAYLSQRISLAIQRDAADIDANVEKPKDCVSVEGKGAKNNCYECRFCNDSIQNSLYRINPVKVVLKNDKCTSQVELCCVDPGNWLNLRSNDRCGKPNPDGIPRRRRQFPRSMLQAEFPWRAWVYSKSLESPLCAATFIHEDKMALITLASCVRARAADTLEVAFVRNGAREAVREVIMHESYTPGDDRNNIAILQLGSLDQSPTWSYPACLPQGAPSVVTACVTTSETDLRIESVIPVRSACTLANSTLPESLTCALTPPGDYVPELAAGLYCSRISHSSHKYVTGIGAGAAHSAI